MSIRNGIIFLVFFCGAALCGDSAGQASTPIQVKTEFATAKAGKFVFLYKVDGPNLVAKVSYPTMGWVAVGFNPVKMMLGANFILGTIVDGKAAVSDEFGDSKYSHVPDSTQGGKNDLVTSDVVLDKGMMIMSFTIPLNSGDTKDAVLEKGRKITVLFAAGKKPGLKAKHSDIEKTTITLQ
jgi:hypothetical protein